MHSLTHCERSHHHYRTPTFLVVQAAKKQVACYHNEFSLLTARRRFLYRTTSHRNGQIIQTARLLGPEGRWIGS